MLKNKDLKAISKAHTLLGMIWAYTIDIDNNELYNETRITSKDLLDSMNALNHIYVQETMKHLRASEKANAWNKAHPEQHRKHSKDSERRHRERVKEYQHEYYLKRKVGK